MLQSYSIEFSCSPKYEIELINEVCELIDKFQERNPYSGNNVVKVKICDPKEIK